jgi:hypothetical protein
LLLRDAFAPLLRAAPRLTSGKAINRPFGGVARIQATVAAPLFPQHCHRGLETGITPAETESDRSAELPTRASPPLRSKARAPHRFPRPERRHHYGCRNFPDITVGKFNQRTRCPSNGGGYQSPIFSLHRSEATEYCRFAAVHGRLSNITHVKDRSFSTNGSSTTLPST